MFKLWTCLRTKNGGDWRPGGVSGGGGWGGGGAVYMIYMNLTYIYKPNATLSPPECLDLRGAAI